MSFDESAVPAPPWRKRHKVAAGPKPPLTRALVVDTALAILDTEGLDGLSMRRVAHELNTGPATLYAHVANKEELLELAFDRVVAEIDMPDPDPDRWQEQIRQVCLDTYRVLGRHSDIARVALGKVPTGPNSLRVSDRMLAILLAGGVPAQIAAWSLDRLYLYLSSDSFEGSIHLATQRATGMGMEEYYAKFVGDLRGFMSSLPPEHFPALTAHVDEMTSGGGDERFLFGLDLLIQGIAAHARKS
jgi:AcrR family transcriptional regulator